MQTRRLVAAAVIVVVVIVLALLIKSCDSSATNSALKNYNASVYNLINASDATGEQVFNQLESGNLSNVDLLAKQVQAADMELQQAQNLHPPSQMSDAQSQLVYVMQLRAQAIRTIAAKAPQAANKNTSKDAVYDISIGTSELFASDVLYKFFVAPDIAKALNAAGIPVGLADNDQRINPGQIVTDLGWLQSTWIADKIGAQQSTAQANANNDQPGLTHGDQLNYVTVDGTQLTSGGSYTIPASQGQTWVLNVTDGGQTSENDVGCSVKIQNASDAGTSVIPTIASGATTDCTVHLVSKPPAGPYSVTATVAKVPGEKNLQNNTATYTVTFN